MAKKKSFERKKLSFSDIIKGNFLYREEIIKYHKIFIVIFIIGIASIYLQHTVNKKTTKIITLKEEVEEYKSRNAYAQSRLIKVKMESELGKEMVKDSLMTLESHPHKLLIKPDTTNAKRK